MAEKLCNIRKYVGGDGSSSVSDIIDYLPTKLACTGYGKFDNDNQNGSGTLTFKSPINCTITLTTLTGLATSSYIKNNTTGIKISKKNATLAVSQEDSLTFYVKTVSGSKGGTKSGNMTWSYAI